MRYLVRYARGDPSATEYWSIESSTFLGRFGRSERQVRRAAVRHAYGPVNGRSGPIKPLLSEATGLSIAMKGQGYINATSTVERGFLEVGACQLARMLPDVGLRIPTDQKLTP